MRNALPRAINPDIQSLPPSDDSGWTTRGLRKSRRDYDQAECQRSIAIFMADYQDRSDIVE